MIEQTEELEQQFYYTVKGVFYITPDYDLASRRTDTHVYETNTQSNA